PGPHNRPEGTASDRRGEACHPTRLRPAARRGPGAGSCGVRDRGPPEHRPRGGDPRLRRAPTAEVHGGLTMSFDFSFTPDQEAFREAVRQFLDREVRPVVVAMDETETFPQETVRKMQAEGY